MKLSSLSSTYTKHYYIGSERIASSIGTGNSVGYYLCDSNFSVQDYTVFLNQKMTQAAQSLQDDYDYFEKQLVLNNPFTNRPSCTISHSGGQLNYWFYPDHLGSSSYISNDNGEISQHLEYLPFGETLVEEHKNSNNSPYKFNGKELDDETGNYYYGARYLNPKWSLMLSVDPLTNADKNIMYSPYSYAINNPISYIDPDGRCWQKVGESYVPCNDADVGSTTTGAFGHSWTMTKNDGWQLTNDADPNNVNYGYDHIEPTGDKSFYEKRYINILEKYNTRPPDYLLEYGYNNKILFDKAYPTMSNLAKEVFDKIGPGLQDFMNDGIRDDPSIQGDNDAFKKFAYNSHYPVYKQSGVGKLGGDDLLRMANIPPKEHTYYSLKGWALIIKLAWGVVGSERPKIPDLWDPQKNPGLKRPGEF